MSFCRLTAAAILLLGPSAAWSQSSPTLDKVKATGVVAIGTREASIPFNYLDDKNQQAGLSWEIALKVVDALRSRLNMPDLRVNPVNVTPQTRIPLVANGTLDLECSSTTNNTERQRQVSFSNTFFVVGSRLLVRKDSGIRDWPDVAGKNVVVSAGTTAERILRKLSSDNNWQVNVVLAKDISENFLMVETGRAVAAMQDDVILFSNIARARNPALWQVVGAPQQREAYACMSRKDDAVFKAMVDGIIADLMRSGGYEALYTKYFLKPIAVKGGITVNLPLSDDMTALIRDPNDRPYQ
ncbi:transporter substrate-binding domain-containing protein [Reyranella sp. CPCC 100927]|uniref:transporter substrate-binding domain-containing protein n=1 Tax=Reyranella sp. CPCC 100927 TaxID=2599616 RepID=UPI0011B759B8|nr:transporter substrate-binding domain-containing protein [Reyranella sp. CPCC 100927]TWT13974.1 transporter substrate-binding domain-containing protein [Reyranella sp. CPCC 100927]